MWFKRVLQRELRLQYLALEQNNSKNDDDGDSDADNREPNAITL